MPSKRTRVDAYDNDSDSEQDTSVDITEATYRAISILVNDTRAGKVTKHKALGEKMGGMKWPLCKNHINKVLSEKFGFQVAELPREDGGPARGEVLMLSTLSPECQKLVNKYTYKRNLQLAGKQRMIVLFVIVEGDECTDRVLFQRLLRLKVFGTMEEAKACVQRMQAMRLLNATKQSSSGTDATIIYSIGPAACLLYDKATVVAQLKSIVGYDDDNQIPEIRDQNDKHITGLVERSLT